MAQFEASDVMRGSQVSVDTSSTLILDARSTRRRVILRNNDGTNPVYITGDETATTSDFIVKAGESVELRTKDALRGIATGAAVTLHVMEEYD